jgi:hypothetical protein
MRYYTLDPEVSGSLGPGTIMDSRFHPPTVDKLHFVLDAWLGDDLIQSFPCYLVSPRLKLALQSLRPSGVEFAPAEVTTSDSFAELERGLAVPLLCWMKVKGRAGKDDIGLTNDARLVVSSSVLEEMQRFSLDHCVVKDYSAKG